MPHSGQLSPPLTKLPCTASISVTRNPMTPRLVNVRIALSLLVLFAVATPALADHDKRRADLWIKYDDLPRRARETVDRERRGHDVKQVLEMRRDGHTYFRAL